MKFKLMILTITLLTVVSMTAVGIARVMMGYPNGFIIFFEGILLSCLWLIIGIPYISKIRRKDTKE